MSECGCYLADREIVYCPLHKAAPEMVKALKDTQFWFVQAKPYIPLHSATLGAINEALASAEVK